MCDYLEILLSQCQASSLVHSMAWYLADSVLLHPELTWYALILTHSLTRKPPPPMNVLRFVCSPSTVTLQLSLQLPVY